METLTDHPSTERLDSYDKYPSYYGSDLELVYTPEQSVFTLWAPSADRVRLNLYASGEEGDPDSFSEQRPGRTCRNGKSRLWNLANPYRP